MATDDYCYFCNRYWFYCICTAKQVITMPYIQETPDFKTEYKVHYDLPTKELCKIWTNGCFDILHTGHIKLFEFAEEQVELLGFRDFKLTVGIDSDRRIQDKKSYLRPIISEEDRKEILMSLSYVDDVVIFDSDRELENLIKIYSPDLLVVGEEYKDEDIIGFNYAHYVRKFPRIEKYSSTNIVDNILLKYSHRNIKNIDDIPF